MILVFIVLGIIAIIIVGYAFTHPVRSLVSLAKYLCIALGLILLFFTLSVATGMDGPWVFIGIILTVAAFFSANRLSALRKSI